MEWLYHKKPLFLMHWKDGKVPQSVQDKVVVIPGGDALKSLIAIIHQQSQRSWQHQSITSDASACQIWTSSQASPCTADHCIR